ncbi:hypothetical protein B0H14DRAFT_2357377, partial [Mycena olivaceomarginata]
HHHKQIIIDLGIREPFNIPKFHAIQHYVDCIRALGSPDGYNIPSRQNASTLTLLRRLTAPAITVTIQSKWLLGCSVRRQWPFALPTSTGTRSG